MTPLAFAEILDASFRLRSRVSANERELQDAIADHLATLGIAFTREHRITPRDRLDFLVGDIAVEVKVKGSLSDLTRQVYRYAEHASVGGMLIVSTLNRHRGVPPDVLGKPCTTLCLADFLL